MFKQYLLPLFILTFLFTGCAERGLSTPSSATTHSRISVPLQQNSQKTAKSVSPASSMVEPIEHTEKPDTAILDSVQNNIAGVLVLVIAAVLAL